MPLLEGRAVELAVSKPQSSIYALLKYEPPAQYAGAHKPVEVELQKDGRVDWSKAVVVPSEVVRTQTRCYIRVDRWHELDCATNGTIDPKTARAAIEAALSLDETLALVLHVKDARSSEGAWRSFELKRKSDVPPTPSPAPIPAEDLTTRCEGAVSNIKRTTGEMYVACVDVIPEKSGAITLLCSFKGTTHKLRDDRGRHPLRS